MSDSGTPAGAPVINDRYRIERRVGRGGMADVFLARDTLLDRDVAVKVLFPEFAVDPKFVERFRREAQSAANLSHPNIVNVYDWGKYEGTYFIAMEYVPGRTLADICRNGRQLTAVQAAEIASEVAAALGFAHDAGLAHRDIKPANILISTAGNVKVADFGIARAMNAPTESNLTQVGSVMGTASYFSPEQAQGAQPDPRSDLYSLGIVMYEMVAGRTPFKGENAVAIAYKQVHDTAEPIATHNPDVPRGYEAMVTKLLRKNPADRYDTAQALRDDLKRFRNGDTTVAISELDGTGATPAANTVVIDTVAPTAAPSPAGAPIVIDDLARGTDTAPAPAPAATSTERIIPGADIPGNPAIASPDAGPSDMSNYPPGASPDAAYYDDIPPRTGWYALAAFVALVALIAGGVILYQRLSDDETVATTRTLPNFVNQRLSTVTGALVDLGLDPRAVPEASNAVAEEFVHRTDPEAGTVLVEGTPVIVYYNPAQSLQPVPNVAGFTLADGRSQLTAAGFVTSESTEASDVASGLIIRTEPAAGSQIRQDTPVLIVVSGGPDEVTIPASVVNGPELLARDLLQGLGLDVTVTYQTDPEVPSGTVVRTDPAPDTVVARGTTITLFVSAGPGSRPMPPLIGLDAAGVEEVLGTDFEVEILIRDMDDPADPTHDTVVEQAPLPGTEVDLGSDVTVVFANAPQAPTADFDGDGITNATDTDDDDDGFLDTEEIDAASDPFDADETPQSPAADFDGDGTPNRNDTDDDDDGYRDSDELDADADPYDPDVTPISDTADFDGDGTPNSSDTDDDGDGFSDTQERDTSSDPFNALNTPNSDNDGDGFTNLEETSAGTDPDDAADSPAPPTTAATPTTEAAPPAPEAP